MAVADQREHRLGARIGAGKAGVGQRRLGAVAFEAFDCEQRAFARRAVQQPLAAGGRGPDRILGIGGIDRFGGTGGRLANDTGVTAFKRA